MLLLLLLLLCQMHFFAPQLKRFMSPRDSANHNSSAVEPWREEFRLCAAGSAARRVIVFHYISSVRGFVRSLHEHRDGIYFKEIRLKSWRPLEFQSATLRATKHEHKLRLLPREEPPPPPLLLLVALILCPSAAIEDRCFSNRSNAH